MVAGQWFLMMIRFFPGLRGSCNSSQVLQGVLKCVKDTGIIIQVWQFALLASCQLIKHIHYECYIFVSI